MMRICVIGAGALGCLFAALLADGGAEVSLCDTDEAKIAAIKSRGVCLIDNDEEYYFNLSVSAQPDDGADLYLVLVKSAATPAVADVLCSCLPQQARVLTLQNGLGNAETLAERIAAGKIFAGVTYHGAYELSPGVVRHTGRGQTLIAAYRGGDAQSLVEQLRACGWDIALAEDLDLLRWQKLVVNCAINPLTAAHGLLNGQLLEDPLLLAEMREIVDEVCAVSAGCGKPLDPASSWAKVLSTCELTATNHSSMLTDIEHGRLTEIGAINGSIVRYARELGMTVPANERACRMVAEAEQRAVRAINKCKSN